MKSKTNKTLLFVGVSMAAICGSSLGAAALAQTANTDSATATAPADGADETEVVVVGVRKSLKTAQQIKKDADTIVDSITATDIGAFPDKSVAEALQRVAGITVSRFASTGDTAHFSAEPSGVIVRGLPQVRSEFNGRDSFSATSSRGLSWGDVTPELMAGVDTYKNQTADLIEGGIAGSINLRTRVPFDSKGRVVALSADANYGSLTKEWTPSVSGIYSDRFDSSIGEFGIMANLAYSQVLTNTQGDQLGRMVHFAPGVLDDGTGVPTTTDNYVPSGMNLYANHYDRVRNGEAIAAQWQNNEHTMVLTMQYNRSEYENTWMEHSIGTGWAWYGDANQWPQDFVETNPNKVRAAPGTTMTFGSDGMLQTGVLNGTYDWTGEVDNSGVDWSKNPPFGGHGIPGSTVSTAHHFTGNNPEFIEACASPASEDGRPCRRGVGVQAGSTYFKEHEINSDVSLNFKWDISDRLRTNFDVQYVHATRTKIHNGSSMETFANLAIDLSGKYPKMALSAPTRVNLVGGDDSFANADNYHFGNVQDGYDDSYGHEFATRMDAQYDFESTWFNSLRMGVRYAERDQTVRFIYNWQNIANDWTKNGDIYMATSPLYKDGIYSNSDFGTDFMGQSSVLSVNGNTTPSIPFVNWSVLGDPSKLNELLGLPENPQLKGDYLVQTGTTTDENGNEVPVYQHNLWGSSWNPVCSNAGARAGETTITDFGCYKPGEILSINEKTTAAYVMLKFGGPDAMIGGIGVSGNVGLRWVQTEDAAKGAVNYPNVYSPSALECEVLSQEEIDEAALHNQFPTTTACLLKNMTEDVAFASGTAQLNNDSHTHINFLPSFNLKLALNDTWVLRFAASRAMSRPDVEILKNYLTVNTPGIPGSALDMTVEDPNRIFDSTGKLVGYKLSYTGNAGNSALKSTTADQFDISIENYFASVGSFSFDLFYKKFHDYIQAGRYDVAVTNAGVTRTVHVTGPVNGDGASLKGFEVAYQRTFDFLPSPFNGLGVQANYTHINNTGVANANLNNTSSGESVISATQAVNISGGVLEGLSPDSFNVVVFYDKGKFGGRLAYNWRSKYLVSSQDCCVTLPVWQEDTGYLDGSLRYAVTDNVEVSVQASNILGTITHLTQQVTGDTPEHPDVPDKFLPNAYFATDQRVQVGVRMKF